LRRILLAGAGHAHIAVLRRFAKSRPGAAVVLINDGPFAWYTGALPALIRRDIAPPQARLDLRALAAACGATFVDARYAGFEDSRALFEDHDPIGFDVLSVSTGVEKFPGGVKPIPAFLRRLRILEQKAAPDIGILGAGAAGVEIALSLRSRIPAARIFLQGAKILPHAPRGAQDIGRLALRAAGIVTAPLPDRLDDLIRAYTPAPTLTIRPTLQLADHETIFAAGDCAKFSSPLPASGAIAVRQGALLAHNLTQARLKMFRPPAATLAIISLDRGRALAWHGRFFWAGRLPMRLKTWLDEQWLAG
jgi:selenide,water dikinase